MVGDAAPGFRLAELVAALSLATDLGTGQPLVLGHLLVVDGRGRARLPAQDRRDVFFTALRRFLGCMADAPDIAALAGGDGMAFLTAMAPVAMGGHGTRYRRWSARSAGADPDRSGPGWWRRR